MKMPLLGPEEQVSRVRLPRRTWFYLWLWFCAVATFVFWRALWLPYGFDDIELLTDLGMMRSGLLSKAAYFVFPHNEHVFPLVRLLFIFVTHLSGLDSWTGRVAAVLIHAAGAMGCALATLRVTREKAAAIAAGTLYAGAAAFGGSVVWVLTATQFSILGAFLAFALAVLAKPGRQTARLLLPLLGLMAGAWLGMVGAVTALTAIPCYLFLSEPRASRLRMTLFGLGAQLLLLLTGLLLMASGGFFRKGLHLSGIVSASWLCLAAPFNFVRSWCPLDLLFGAPVLSHVMVASAVLWLVLLFTFRFLNRSTQHLVIAGWTGALVFLGLVGLARAKEESLLDLLITDRYYYITLLPLCLQTAAVGVRFAVIGTRSLPEFMESRGSR